MSGEKQYKIQSCFPSLSSRVLGSHGKFHTCPHLARQHHQRRQQQQHYGSRSSHVARITGTRQEYDKEGIIDPEQIWGEDADNEYIEVENIPIYDPDQGGLNVRVFPDAEDEKSNKEINLQDTAYWFPIQLELIEPAHLRQHIMKPEQYVAAELGRHYEDQIGVLEPDHGDLAETRDYQFGHDAPDGNPYPGDWMSRELAEPGLREVMFKEVATTPGEPSSWGI
eukprot:gene7865-8059_t